MAEYIEREALLAFPIRIDHYDKENGNLDFVLGIETVMEYAENIPAADVEVVKHGRWKLGRGGKGTCDQCNFTQLNVWDYDNWQRYCGCCGAKMEDAYSDG